MIEKLEAHFKRKYPQNSNSIRSFFSPSKINIMGEHVDYCGGNSLPAALQLGTYGLVAKRNDDQIVIYSLNKNQTKQVSTKNLSPQSDAQWASYMIGVFDYLQKEGAAIPGMNIFIWGNVPLGIGLSASASLELLAGVIACQISGFEIEPLELVKLCQKVEEEYLLSPCGITDQLAVGMGKKDHMILVSGDSLKYRYIPNRQEKYEFILINSNKLDQKKKSEYKTRKETCNKALRKIQTMFPKAQKLADLNFEDLESAVKILDDLEVKRASHVVSESQRVKEVVRSFANNDFFAIGKAMYSSHISLKNDYNVSSNELDCLIDISKLQKGVLGARLTGKGFGGCAVALIEKSSKDEYIKTTDEKYHLETGIKATFYPVMFSDGAKELVKSA